MIKTYTPALRPGAGPAPQNRTRPPVDEARTSASAGAPSPEISKEEQSMIERFFPENERMTLRLYGPGRPSTVDPGALGGRLDLKG